MAAQCSGVMRSSSRSLAVALEVEMRWVMSALSPRCAAECIVAGVEGREGPAEGGGESESFVSGGASDSVLVPAAAVMFAVKVPSQSCIDMLALGYLAR